MPVNILYENSKLRYVNNLIIYHLLLEVQLNHVCLLVLT